MLPVPSRPIRAFSRRLLVLVAAVATAGLVPAWPAVGTPPEAASERIRVERWTDGPTETSGSGSGATATDVPRGWRVSPVLEVDDLVMVGADWGGDDAIAVEVRTRGVDGWSAWTPLHVEDEHAPDPGSPEAQRALGAPSDPLWVGPSEAVQIRRAGGAPNGAVEVIAIRVSGGDGLAYRPNRHPRGSASAAPAQPSIIDRRSWGADESIRQTPTYAEDVRFAVVHHTAGRNDYDCSQSDDIVRSIYEYHVNGNGWDDIAYNFLVDRCGQVFEGRYGGITEPVIGAHAAGWNGGSTGVSVLGNFDTVEPPAAVLDALDRLLAWKLDVHHVDPFGTTEELAGGGGSNRFERNDRVTLPTIIGHRVTNSTSCPGENLVRHIVREHPDQPRSEPTARWEPVASSRVEPIGTPKLYGGPPAEVDQPVTGHRPRWDVGMTSPLDWRLTIHDRDGELVRSTGGTDDEQVDLAWDLRDTDGHEVPPGTYTARFTGWEGLGQATPIETTLEVTAAASRVAGTGRIETAVELSRWAFESSSHAVLATADTYADALAATPLAGSFGAPVLLTPKDHLPDVVAEEMRRLDVDEVWIIGGTAAISEQVGAEVLTKVGLEIEDVHRLAGGDRFATAYAVADHVLHREDSTEVLVALGAHSDAEKAFPDALSAGGLGAEFDLPIVLVTPDVLPSSTQAFLEEHDLNDVRVFGGPAAVGPNVEQAIDRVTTATIHRFAGADRYDTSRMAAEDALRRWAEWEQEIGGRSPYLRDVGIEVVTASGANWPDALGAGAAADERRRSVFLLTPPSGVDPDGPTGRFVRDRADEVTHVVVSGGEAAVSEQARADLATFVRHAGPHLDDPLPWPEDPHAPPELPAPGPTSSPSPSPSPSPAPSPTSSPSPT